MSQPPISRAIYLFVMCISYIVSLRENYPECIIMQIRKIQVILFLSWCFGGTVELPLMATSSQQPPPYYCHLEDMLKYSLIIQFTFLQ